MQKLKLTAVALMLMPLLSGAAMAAQSTGSVKIDLGPQGLTGAPEIPPPETGSGPAFL